MGNEVGTAKIGVETGERERGSTKETRRTVIASAPRPKKTTNFTYYYPNWESYLDDTGNTYFFNQITKETSWNPAGIYDTSYLEQQPFPESADETSEDWETGPAPALNSTGKSFSKSGLTNLYEKRAQQIQERKEILKEDARAPWKELCELGNFDYETVEDHVEEATDVVLQVSGGSFEPELLYKLPWAYKVQQLSAAVKDSYVNVGDMLDSSKYDNCNDVPRYDNGGLLAWWMDLEDMHTCVNMLLESGVVGQEAEAYSEEMKKLQEIAASGNEEELIEGFLARKNSVEKELDGLRARCFAVVSLDSGPTREQLDNLYMYLKENVNSNTSLDDIQDEMEEVVSTWLEQKHRFMVDVVLMMGLLEDEHERLQKRITTWSGDPYRPKNHDGNPEAMFSGDSADELERSQDELSQDYYDGEYQEEGAYDYTGQEDYQYIEGTAAMYFTQQNGEVAETMIIENVPEGGVEPISASQTGTLSSFQQQQQQSGVVLDKTVLNQDKSLVASKVLEQAQEAKKLAEELAYQKEQRAKALKERLALKKSQRTQQIVEEEGVDIETAKLRAEVEISEEVTVEEERMNCEALEVLGNKDEELKAKLDEIYQEEADRVTREGEMEREEKMKEVKERYEQEKNVRVAELMEEMGYTAEVAQALCEDEFEERQMKEMSRLEKEIAEKTEKRRLVIVETIRNEHLKSNTFLENELTYQKEQKTKSLKNRLEKRKELRTNELLSKMEVHEAVAVANLEIQQILTSENKKIDDEYLIKLDENQNKKIQLFKDISEKETVRNEQDLLLQENRQKMLLQTFLNKKEKRREEELKLEGIDENEAKKIAEEEIKSVEEESLIKLNQEIAEIKQTQEIQAQKLMDYHVVKKESQQKSMKERLAKRKAKKETELTLEEKLEKFLKGIREKQKVNLEKLNQFIESEKIKLLAVAEKQDAEEIGSSGMGGNGGQRVMQTMLLIGLVKESLVNGYKKQCVYEIRAIKEMKKLEDLTQEELQKAMSTASEQLIIQHCRDLKSLMDTQLAEQQRTRLKLENDCAPMEKILEMEEKYYKRNVDALRKQQNKLFLSLCGVHIRSDWLISEVKECDGGSSGAGKNVLDDEDEDDLFDDDKNSRKMNEVIWDSRVCQWFEGSLGLQNIYDKVPEALLSKFQVVMLRYKAQVQANEASASDAPIVGAVLYQVTLVVLKAISESFQSQVSNSSSVSNYSSASPDDIKPFLGQAIETAKSNLSLEAALNSMEASQSIQLTFKTALQEFLKDPTTPTSEFYEILQALKAKACAPAVASPAPPSSTPTIDASSTPATNPQTTSKGGGGGKSDDNEERKNRMIKSIETRVERKRRDLQEKYRKRMEQKTHECKEAKIEVPEEFIATEDKTKKEELNCLALALEEVKDLVEQNADSLQSVSVDGLMHAIEKKLKGEEIETTDLKQLEIEATKENEKMEAKRLLKLQKDEAEKLDVMLKVQRAREQQALQKRLLARKSKVPK